MKFIMFKFPLPIGTTIPSRNDKHVVKLDENVDHIRKGWYKNVSWKHFDREGRECGSRGLYLICDGGYLRWPCLICPFKHESCSTQKGYFSSNLESVRKDVECTFGILKKRWKILEYGIRFNDIKVVENIFIVCSMLHNMMLGDAETSDSQIRVGRGAPLEGDAIWLRNDTNVPVASDNVAAVEWLKRRNELAAHCEFMNRCAKRHRTS